MPSCCLGRVLLNFGQVTWNRGDWELGFKAETAIEGRNTLKPAALPSSNLFFLFPAFETLSTLRFVSPLTAGRSALQTPALPHFYRGCTSPLSDSNCQFEARELENIFQQKCVLGDWAAKTGIPARHFSEGQCTPEKYVTLTHHTPVKMHRSGIEVVIQPGCRASRPGLTERFGQIYDPSYFSAEAQHYTAENVK
ncbi:hypothetical protein VTI74DRAFT_10679 [Chaetomium olivicolor]